MRNVACISQTEAQKSSDLYMKCRYLDELTGGKGCIFATGTPISNTMVELYTMQKYLQYDELQLRGFLNFDAWASTFGETVTAIELAPDGSGYRAKTRFAKFPNENGFSPMEVMGTTYTEKAEAGKAILAVCERINSPDERPLGEYRGFKMEIGFDTLSREFFINLKGKLFHKVPLGQDANGIITRLDNAIEAFEKRKQGCELQLEELHKQVENAKAEIAKPFAREAELEEKCKRLAELNVELNMDKRENEIVDGAEEQSEEERDENSRTRSDRADR